jgi:cytochrome c biogenesis protein CcmG/thiol:disulfide interchange protein DsbE
MLAVVVLCVAVVGSVLAFGLTRDPSVVRPVLIGTQAPPFAARTLDGSRVVRSSDLRGQVVVLNFWSSWCAECVIEHPALSGTWDRFRDRGVVVLGMDFDDAPGAAAAFAARLGVTYPLVSDPGDRTAIALGVTGPPETFLIAADGTIAGKHIGPVSAAQLTSEIQTLLGGSPG